MNNDLYDFAEQLNIAIFSFPLPNSKSLALEDSDDNCYIGIDDERLESSKDERVHIAHEIGHCVTGAFYNEYSPVDNRGKFEAIADRWAVKKLINKDELKKQIKRGLEIWELAEYFSVTEDFIQKAFHLYFEVEMI